jgi:opacity protein-like surface antigen
MCCCGFAAPAVARAADLAAASNPAGLPRPVWSWTGFYAGVHLGSGWANDTWRSGTGFLTSPGFNPFLGAGSGSGTLGGGQVGANYQIGPLVLGAEVSASIADIGAESPCGIAQFNCVRQVDGLGALAGRLGFAFDQFLIYGKGGATFEHVHDCMVPFLGLGNSSIFNGSASLWGWTAGAGLEFAFNRRLSAFAEYDFLDFGRRGVAVSDQFGNGASVATTENLHLVKVGLNYKLGEGVAPWAMGTRATPIFPAPPPAPWSWTGAYVGGHVGGGWVRPTGMRRPAFWPARRATSSPVPAMTTASSLAARSDSIIRPGLG